ncbi:MAG TPA: hypothetical protein PK677_07730 [Acidiphilium sp.]|nr:MAG: hypothetical protein B7Z67_02130 [Acidiphilium sp. 21-60-14]OYV92091.1 MAG: hypothetical protein B7Z57_01985 [Acidiphilium sp. 37-60-79]HQT88432.1 hypothetical protein [Acidiphilium sp.]HQU23257.1 hypothetical protein [Acidiphilium sp.]
MLDIETFDNVRGGNSVYKALAHPLAAEKLALLAAQLREARHLAVFDPDGIFAPLRALAPDFPVAGLYVDNTLALGTDRAGYRTQPLTDLPQAGADMVLIAAFDAQRLVARLRAILPASTTIISLDAVRLPDAMLTNRRRYLDPLNFATNFVLFRDDDHLATRLITANYWSGYGATSVKFWLRLYDGDGVIRAEFEQPIPPGAASITLDSQAVRAAHQLGPFTGQLFIHAIGVAGHDVVKYALDTYATDGSGSLSCTHDANAWPSERFAGLPAPRPDEQVILWVQNSHAVTIPSGAISLDRMGAEQPAPIDEPIPPFATRAIDVATLLPGLHWPAQTELRAGRHLVRPRYEVVRNQRTRIAHINVERADLAPDPSIKTLSPLLGRGFLLPFPILPRRDFSTIGLPTPMAHRQDTLPLRLDIFAPDGTLVTRHPLGLLARDHAVAVDLDTVLPPDMLHDGGHGELVYDFSQGGDADGWLHGLFRYERRDQSHAAETSFGAHIFNTLMTWKNEPQSYAGPPPGLSTRLFLDLGTKEQESFAVLIYPASAPWHPQSDTTLILHDKTGNIVAEMPVHIPCSGSRMVAPHQIFAPDALKSAEDGYVLIRDTTCRLFGYHGKRRRDGAFSLDHMFGF